MAGDGTSAITRQSRQRFSTAASSRSAYTISVVLGDFSSESERGEIIETDIHHNTVCWVRRDSAHLWTAP